MTATNKTTNTTRYRILVGGKSRFDGPIGKTIEDAWNGFVSKRGSSLPHHVHVCLDKREGKGKYWEGIVSDAEYAQFLALVKSSELYATQSVRISKTSF